MRPGFFLAIVFAPLACSTATFTHGATIGELTPHSALLWVRTSRPTKLEIALVEKRGGTLRRLQAVTRAGADSTAHIELVDLRAGSDYGYEIRPSGSYSEVVRGTFRTPALPHEAVAVRFVFGGDIAGQNHCRDVVRGFPIFAAMEKQKPNFFLGLGDLIYADSLCAAEGALGNRQVPGLDREAVTLEDYRAVWRYVRADPLYVRFLSAVPLFAIWDDHEVRNDFGPTDDRPNHTGEERLFPAGARAFVEYNPVRLSRLGTFYRTIRFGRNVELFILDTRSRRDPNAASDSPEKPKTMLGAAQREQFLHDITSSKALWKFVVSSVPLSVPTGLNPDVYGMDGWANDGRRTGFEGELQVILSALARARVRNLVFLSTDVHFASVLRYRPFPEQPDFVFHEFITGPMQAGLYPERRLDPTFRPERLFFHGPEGRAKPRTFEEALQWFNFGDVSVNPAGRLEFRVVTAEGRTVFSLPLAAR